MVKAICTICHSEYSGKMENAWRRAEKCESQGIIGPEIEPGLLLTEKTLFNSYLIYTGKELREGHKKIYEFDPVYFEYEEGRKGLMFNVNSIMFDFDSFPSLFGEYGLASDNETMKFNHYFSSNNKRKSLLENNGIKKIHNNFDMSQLK